ncbi:MAG: hypothetical protein LUC41_00090 [Clostridiales bacterium]|nr:hypothetical protein [Clostridiales bacterium]
MTDMEIGRRGGTDADDLELISILAAISVTSKRLAGKLIRLSQADHSKEGGRKSNEAVRGQSGYRGDI